MARKIKRLSNMRRELGSIDQLMRRDPKAWGNALAWWLEVGVDANMLVVVLESARLERSRYEEQLRGRADSELTAWKISRVRNALKGARPLIRLMRTEWSDDGPPDLFFGDLGEQVERAAQSYIGALRPAPEKADFAFLHTDLMIDAPLADDRLRLLGDRYQLHGPPDIVGGGAGPA